MPRANSLDEVIINFNPMEPLPSTSDWYVERPDNPHNRIKAYLLNDRADSKILFHGFRGAGKSSALNKLAAEPEIQDKFFVIQFSIKDELNVADLAYTDLLVAIGHRIYEEAIKITELNPDLSKHLDTWAAEITTSTTKSKAAEAGTQGGIKTWFLNATGMLKTGFEEKREFRLRFEPRVPQLILYINELIRAIETSHIGREVLLIIEDLDKPTVDQAIDLFDTKGPIMVQPACTIIFTVPSALLYSGRYNIVREMFHPEFALPNLEVKTKAGDRKPKPWELMRDIALRRLDHALIQDDALNHAVEMSGGVVRELIRIIQGAATEARANSANSIAMNQIQRTIGQLRTEYSYTLTEDEDIEILKRVRATNELRWKNREPLLKLLHQLFILMYSNGENWYGINPIVEALIGSTQ